MNDNHKKMTFGYLYDFRNPKQWHKPWTELYSSVLEFVTWTESLGFQGAWVPEHHCAEDGYVPSPLVALAAIAARTKTIKLGSAVALAPFYHPVRFAEDCAIVDILSNGRLEMALAVGYRRREAETYGADFSSRGRRTDAFLQIVRSLWAGQSVTHQCKDFALKNASIAPRPVHGQIPLYLGGFSAAAIERAAKFGDGYIGNIDGGDLYLEKLRACGKEAANARIRLVDLLVVVARDPERAMHELAPYFHYVNNAYAQWAFGDRTSTGFDEEVGFKLMTLEQFKTSGKLRILTPSQAITFFSEMLSTQSAEHFMMLVPPGIPLSQFAEYSELFAKEVMPAFG